MIPLTDWNTTQARTSTAENAAKLTAGGHIVEILKAESTTNAKGLPMLLVYFDIKENSEFDGYFMALHTAKKRFNPDVTYKGVYRQPITDEAGHTNQYFKGLITSVEESNPGYRWNWDEKTLKGKKIGMVFREEEYSYNGYTGFNVKPCYVCDVKAAPAMPVPTPKKLNPNAVVAPAPVVMQEDTDEELPF